MAVELKILTAMLLEQYVEAVKYPPLGQLNSLKKVEILVDYFQFYKSVSSVYSSKIEGENIEFDSFFKHKFLKVKFKPDYTKKADDLYKAYDFIEKHKLNWKNVQRAHGILSDGFLPKSQRGWVRTNPMFVINNDDRIEYVAAEPSVIKRDLKRLFQDVELLLQADLNSFEVFYYAALLHLVFVKIHPFQDGNGRTARLLERWFLISKIGEKATEVQLEKNYYLNLNDYYENIRKLGLEYDKLDYTKALDFLLMTVKGIGVGR